MTWEELVKEAKNFGYEEEGYDENKLYQYGDKECGLWFTESGKILFRDCVIRKDLSYLDMYHIILALG